MSRDAIYSFPKNEYAMRTFPDDFREVNGVYSALETGDSIGFGYTDGEEFELEIGRVIERAGDRSLFSREIIDAIWDWRSACHLSPVRANILRPLEDLCRGRVLELGSGCGIITRYLGELGGEVVALEASPQRASITRKRTEDLKNVSVVCERLENFDASDKFDVVTMIGVLQYARLFSDLGATAESVFVQNAVRQLKDSGVLVIAIQNRLGLKYFSGYPEPNVDTPYYGIENHYGSDTIIRFGLREIQKLLLDAGLRDSEVLLPVPDYHMPVSVLSTLGVAQGSQFCGKSLIQMSVVRDRARPDWKVPAFSLELASESVFSNGLAKDLSNAFLIVAGRDSHAISRFRDGGALGWHYSVNRHRSFATAKQFRLVGDRLVVQREKLDSAPCPDVPIIHHVESEEYVNGDLLWERLVRLLNTAGWSLEQLSEFVSRWIRALLTEAEVESGLGATFDSVLPGRMFDFTPLNCIECVGGQFRFIDREWELCHSIPMHYLVLRGLFGSLSSIASCAAPRPGTSLNIFDLIKDSLGLLGFDVQESHYEFFLANESRIQSLIHLGFDKGTSSSWEDYARNARLLVRIASKDLQELHSTVELRAFLLEKEGQLSKHEANLRDLDRDVERRGQWVKTKEVQLSSHEANLRSLESDLLRREAWVQQKEAQLDSHQANLTTLEADIRRREEWLITKEGHLNAHQVNLLALETDLRRREDWLPIKESQLSTHETNLSSREADVRRREEWLSIKESQLSTHETNLSSREADVRRREEWVGIKEGQLESHELNLRSFEADLERRGEVLSTQEALILEKNEQLNSSLQSLRDREQILDEQALQIAAIERTLLVRFVRRVQGLFK